MTEEYESERDKRQREYEERMQPRLARHPADRLPIQMSRGSQAFWRVMLHGTRKRGVSVPRIVAEAAWQGYDADGHGSQSCERLHERGDFGLSELGYYLVRAVDEGRVRIEIVEQR